MAGVFQVWYAVSSWFKVWGLSFMVHSGFRVQGLVFGVQGSRCKVQGSGFRVQGAGCRGELNGFKVKNEPPALMADQSIDSQRWNIENLVQIWSNIEHLVQIWLNIPWESLDLARWI